jgi:hypothetical protein
MATSVSEASAFISSFYACAPKCCHANVPRLRGVARSTVFLASARVFSKKNSLANLERIFAFEANGSSSFDARNGAPSQPRKFT